MNRTKIGWTEFTWNYTVGCTPVSQGCKNCYAIDDAWRMKDNPNDKVSGIYKQVVHKKNGRPQWNGKLVTSQDRLFNPIKLKKPRMIFVNSMSDLFHEDMPFDEIDKMILVMALCPQHVFQILTKRPERALEYFRSRMMELGAIRLADEYILKNKLWMESKGFSKQLQGSLWRREQRGEGKFAEHTFIYDGVGLPENIWVGTSIEDQVTMDKRIHTFLEIPAKVRWISFEPLISDVWIPHGYGNKIDWIVVGGESGKGARAMCPKWVENIKTYCGEHNIPFFFKQWGRWIDEENHKAAIGNNADEFVKMEFEDYSSSFEHAFNMYEIKRRGYPNLIGGAKYEEYPFYGEDNE